MVDQIKNVSFLDADTFTSFIPTGMIIYCDPPYMGNKLGQLNSNHSTCGNFFQGFDHDEFWSTIRKWSQSNIVIVSESKAPKDFRKIWQKPYNVYCGCGGNGKQTTKYQECLFVHKDTYGKISTQAKRKARTIGKKKNVSPRRSKKVTR